MIRNQEEDEFVAVRVQDPRMQNEGSWNSYVDYKIFLHTNSKAFTAKTSCVRRRYSEFAWLKKKLQKNAGLVPVPDLPGKSFFYFSNEDFLERRRKGLQAFLDNVVNMTVCLSDSQLHLFLQTQLPVGHIQDCVQGHTPYSVTDAILTYASSNRGYAQAQEDDSIKEPSLTVSYESMESPAPHQPFQTPKDLFRPDLLSCGDSDPLEELGDEDPVEFLHKDTSSVRVRQRDNHLEAVVEDCGPTEVTFFLGDIKDASEILAEQSQQRSCQIQTPVEVHLPMGLGFDEDSTETLDPEETTVTQEPGETATTEEEEVKVETCVSDATSQEEVLEVVCVARLEAETQETSEVDILEHAEDAEVHVQDAEVPAPDAKDVEVCVEGAEVCAQDTEVCALDAKVCTLDAEVHVEDAEVHIQDAEEAEVGVVDAEVRVEEAEVLVVDSEVHVQDAKDAEVRVEDAEVCAQDAEVHTQDTEEAEVHVEGAAVHVEDAEVHVEDAEVHGEDAEVHVEDAEVHVEDAEVRVEDAKEAEVCMDKSEVCVDEAEVHVDEAEARVEDAEVHTQDAEVSNAEGSERESEKRWPLQSDVPEKAFRIPEEEQNGGDDITQLTDQQEVEDVGTKVDSDEDDRSSSNESIVKVSDEESVCDDEDVEDSIQVANGYEEEVEVCSGNIMDLQINGGPAEDQEDEDLHYISDISKSLDLSLTVSAADLTENSDFSILESSCRPTAADGEQTCLDPEDAQEVEVR